MREIKFRAWVEKAQKIADWETILKECDRFSLLSMEGFVFMQFTGLKDKNGTEIYEGDKVKRRVQLVEGSDYMDYTCAVKWNGWCFALFIHDKQAWALDPITAKEIEITGHIYK